MLATLDIGYSLGDHAAAGHYSAGQEPGGCTISPPNPDTAFLKREVTVSAEFTSFIGHGGCDAGDLPGDVIFISFCIGDNPAATILASGDIDGRACKYPVLLAASRAACHRIFGRAPLESGSWHLPAKLRGRVQDVVAIEGDGEAAYMLRGARSIELLHAFFGALEERQLVEVHGGTTLREQDITLVAAAHRIVSEDWHGRLTVSAIARRCGLSRAKLMRGFKELYRCTVTEAVNEQRMGSAQRLLSQSDLRISTVGYRCGYTNNASFSRAFVRRFGMTPTEMRRRAQAASSA